MNAGWLRPMNPEELDVIAYAALKYRGQPGDMTSVTETGEHWERVEQEIKDLIAGFYKDVRDLAGAQRQSTAEQSQPKPQEAT